jgi:predicted Holliday junction resolvase-like endonuclease
MDINILLTITVITFISIGIFLFIQNKKLRNENVALSERVMARDEKINKVNYQRKSSEVRLGKIGENLAPFTEHWPWDANNFRFLGSPIDGVQFTDDEVIFVEIKTGNSRLSKGQKGIKELVDAGKVKFVSFRVGTEGVIIK